MSCRVCALSLLLTATLCASTAFAEDIKPSLDIRTFRSSVDPRAGLASEPIQTPGPWNWNVGMNLTLAHSPVVLKDPVTNEVAYRPLIAQFGGDIFANLGIGSRAALGLSLPVVFAQASGGRALPDTVQMNTVPISAIGDVSVHGKGTFIKNENGGFGLAALGNLTFPTGARTSWIGEGSVTGSLRLVGELSLLIASVQAQLGYSFRGERRTWPDASVGGIRFGDQIPFSFALLFHPSIIKVLDPQNRQTWELGIHGWVPAGPVGPFVDPGASALSPVMLSASDRIEIGHYHDVYVLVGADIGLSQAVGVPLFRHVIGIGWAPRDHDKDKDGITDDFDQCPDIAEDRDNFEDTDGCPEIDNDDDGIIDREDACPNAKGAHSEDPKQNGCPAPDRDHDGIGDDIDACPAIAGEPNSNPKRNGCPSKDGDADGVPDDIDRCPTQAEDKDGFEDDDGCPDPDNDKDGISDVDDACPDKAGDPSSDRSRNGCPNPDRDSDTYPNDKDECPDAAEVFNGIKDEDGCPDDGGKALATIDKALVIKLASPIKFAGAADAPEIDKSSDTVLRALALEVSKHNDWTLLVGAKGANEQQGLLRAIALATTLSRMIQRDGSAESVGWDAVKRAPFGDAGIVIIVAPPPPAPKKP